MNKSLWSFLIAMVTVGLFAQTDTNAPPSTQSSAPTPAQDSSTAASNAAKTAPAKKPAKKKVAKPSVVKNKEANLLKSVPLQPGLAVVVVSNLNVRGQAKLNSEVVARLTKGEVVTVLEEITLKHSAPDEPSAWAKILLPSGSRVWINGTYLDANKTVAARKLNLRGGPGENYSVLGLMLRGETITQVKAKDDWLQIEAPTNAYAFVAAQYLQQQVPEAPAPPTVVAAAPAAVAAVPEPTPPPAPAAETVPPPQTVAAAAPIVAAQPPPAAPVTNAATPPPAAAAPATLEPAAAAVEQPLPPRVVQREGVVRGTLSIQAPTHFELVSTENGKTINYLYTSSPDLDLRRWKGLHILVTGEEGLDERWQNTPVITIQKIELLDEK